MTSAVTNPGEFARLAASLTRPTPIVKAFDITRWPASAFETRWYANQQDHVVGFAAAHPDRQPDASTRQMYRRFAVTGMQFAEQTSIHLISRRSDGMRPPVGVE